MNRLTGSLLAALVPLVGVTAITIAPGLASAAPAKVPPTVTLPTTPSTTTDATTGTSSSTGATSPATTTPTTAPSATTTPTTAPGSPASGNPSWVSLEQTALQATSGARGDGTLNIAGLPSVPAQSMITTPSGPVSLAQQTIVGTDHSGTVVVDLALLGGRQLIVNELSPGDNFEGQTLVLQPGTSRVSHSYHIAGARSRGANTTALKKSPGSSGIITASDGVYHPGSDGNRATLAAAGGCWAYPQNPGVIGSIYGPLIQGTGVIDCSLANENLSMIVGLYQTGSSSWTAGGSAYGSYLGENVYAPCYSSSVHGFQTVEQWAVNSVYQGAVGSGISYYGCVG